MKKDNLLELNIESIGFEGVSIARKDNQVYFVKNGLPGDKVVANILKKHRNYFEATIKEILLPSEHRVSPICEYSGSCGGCTWQCLDYSQQLYWKRQHVIDAYERIGKLSEISYSPAAIISETISAKELYNYRNKMDFSFCASRWLTKSEILSNTVYDKSFALGLHISGRFDKVLDILECSIQPEVWNRILKIIRDKSLELGIKAFDNYKNIGFLKGLCLRNTLFNNETMAILITTDITSESEQKFIEWYKNDLMNEITEIVSVVYAINNNNSVNVGEIQWTMGKMYLTEQVLGVNYNISPFSFFQTNSYQLNTFINKILEVSNLNCNDIIWDLYCGTGSITLPAAKLCKNIYGLEIVESAINDARLNASSNEINNATFFVTDLHSKRLPSLLYSLPHPDLIIVDPPRSGLHTNVIQHILTVLPYRLVYVSCNPATQARDLAELTRKYKILNVYPFDMFPNTYHIEVITELVLK